MSKICHFSLHLWAWLLKVSLSSLFSPWVSELFHLVRRVGVGCSYTCCFFFFFLEEVQSFPLLQKGKGDWRVRVCSYSPAFASSVPIVEIPVPLDCGL